MSCLRTKVLQVPYDLVQYVHDNGRLLVVNFVQPAVWQHLPMPLMMLT